MAGTVQLSSALWGLGVGVAFIVAIWLLVSNAWYRKATPNRIPETDVKPTPIGVVEEYPEGLAEAHGGPTLFLRLLMVAFVLWTVGYIVAFVRAGL